MDFSYSLHDLPRILFRFAFISLMTITCFYVIQPFILGFLWATIMVITTWPLLIKIQNLLWKKRSLAVLIMTLLLLLLLVLPISFLVSSIVDNSAPVITWAEQINKLTLPSLIWLKNVPIIGYRLYSTWQLLISDGSASLITKIQPYIGKAATWLLSQVANLGSLLIHCGLMVFFSIFLYLHGESIEITIRNFAFRLSEKRGDTSLLLAVQAIRAIALGVILTAIIQAVLSGIGLTMTGVPLVIILTVIIFLLCIIQLGPLPVLIPAIIWLYWSNKNTDGTILLIWSFFVAILENIIRPIIFTHISAYLPVPLLLCGVLGGLLSFGMLGLFIGPIVLAVSWHLVFSWIQEKPSTKKSRI